MFVTMKATRSRLTCIPLTKLTPTIFMKRLINNVRAIDMLRVENGRVLVIAGELLT